MWDWNAKTLACTRDIRGRHNQYGRKIERAKKEKKKKEMQIEHGLSFLDFRIMDAASGLWQALESFSSVNTNELPSVERSWLCARMPCSRLMPSAVHRCHTHFVFFISLACSTTVSFIDCSTRSNWLGHAASPCPSLWSSSSASPSTSTNFVCCLVIVS